MPHHRNTTPRRRLLSLGAAVVVATLCIPALAGAAPGSATDPDDVSLRLDLKTVSHTDDGSTITLTSQTYDPFKDEWADFKWGIDKDGDESFDLIVFAEWDEGELVGGIDDAAEEPVSLAQVTRPGPDSIAVTFPAKILGKATSYRYGAQAATDLNANGEEDAGETDLAPDAGLYTHELTGATPAPAATPAAPAPAPVTPKPAAAKPESATPKPEAAASKPTATKDDAKAQATPAAEAKAGSAAKPANTTPVRHPAAAAAPRPAAAVAPKAAAAPQARPAAVTDPASRPSPAPAPAPAAPSNLAHTGPIGDVLLILAGLVLAVAGTLFIIESVLPRAARHH